VESTCGRAIDRGGTLAPVHHGRLDPDIDLLTKPFTADALARKIRRILDAGAAAKQVAEK